MVGIGTIINVVFIIVGGIIGSLIGNNLKPSVQETILSVTGIGVMMLGIGGTMSQMLAINNGKISSQNTIMMIVSLALGALIGEILKIDDKINLFGEWLKTKSNNQEDNKFVNGFVSASCTVCVGAMAIIGAIQDGTSGEYSVLLSKGIIDAIIICIMTISLGKGCIFSVIPVGILQGIVTVIAVFLGSFLTTKAMDNLSYIGYILIFCVGLNLIREKQIRVANVLPAIVVAVVWGYFI